MGGRPRHRVADPADGDPRAAGSRCRAGPADRPRPPGSDGTGPPRCARRRRRRAPRPAHRRPAPVLVGIAGADLVVSAHHALRRRARAARRPRPRGHGAGGVAAPRRGRPPDPRRVSRGPRPDGSPRRRSGRPRRIAAPAGSRAAAATCSPRSTVPGSWRTAEMVPRRAGRRPAHDAAGRDTRHVAVAVGAGRPATATTTRIANRSALIRLTDLEDSTCRGDRASCCARPARAATGARRPAPATGRLMAGGMRLLARRLGSTLLVSHLGEVTRRRRRPGWRSTR